MLFNRFVAVLGCVIASAAPLWAANTTVAEEPKETRQEAKPRDLLHQLDDAFAGVFEKVAPAVVIIEASKKPGADDREEAFDFFFRDPNAPNSPKAPNGQSGDQDKDKDNSARRFFRMPQPLTRSEGSGFVIRPDGYIL